MKRRDEPDDTYADLAWYFQHGEADIGMKSSLGSMLSRIETGIDGGKRTQTDDAMLSRLQAAGRMRKVYSRLHLLKPKQQRILEAAYSERRWPVSLAVSFGPAAGVAIILPLARRAYNDSVGKKKGTRETLVDWMSRCVVCGSKDERAILEVVKARADAILLEAINAYRSVKVPE